MSRRSKRKCPECGKKGIFVNKQQIKCLRCIHLEQGHKLVPNPDVKDKNKVIWNEQIDWSKLQ